MTFISVYRPCRPSSGGGTTTYDQHRRHLQDHEEPRETLLTDLTKFVSELQKAGHLIVIGMDANKSIYAPRLTAFMLELGLHDAVACCHGNKCPSTTTHSLTAPPIDILMCSRQLVPSKSGMKFDTGSISDHAVIWADFFLSDLFGPCTLEFKQYTHMLNADDPRQVQMYNDRSLNLLTRQAIPQQLASLSKIPKGEFT